MKILNLVKMSFLNFVKYTEPKNAPGFINDEIEIAIRFPPYTSSSFTEGSALTQQIFSHIIYVYWKKTNKIEQYNAEKIFHKVANDNKTCIYKIKKKYFVDSKTNKSDKYILSYDGKLLNNGFLNKDFKKYIMKDLNKKYTYYEEENIDNFIYNDDLINTNEYSIFDSN